MQTQAERLRAMYPGGRADRTARRYSRAWAAVFRLGLSPRRWVTLEVTGRRSGRPTRFPLGMADMNGRWYLVPMLGERCNWVRNVRAADGAAILWHGQARRCRLAEIPVSERARILRRYLDKVPGGRPHIPVDRRAPEADFEAIAPRYPVFEVMPLGAPARTAGGPSGPARPRRRRRRWFLGGAAVLVLLLVLAVVAVDVFIGQPAPRPLTLPVRAAAAPAGPIDGTWQVGRGSVAGFRVRESALWISNDVVGRTGAVTGSVTVSGDQVTAATVRVGLAAIKVSGRTQAQVGTSLDTRADPVATFTLARPVDLRPAFVTGSTVIVSVPGYLRMHAVSHLVMFTLSMRRNGSSIQAAGAIPVAFAAWDIQGPAGFGFLGSLADHGTAEFLLNLDRRPG